MPGRKPIFANLIRDIIAFVRDTLYKSLLEPASPAQRRAKRIKKIRKEKQKQTL